MLERINGHAHAGVLGYFMGKNAIVSVAVSETGNVVFKDTGAVASFAELRRYLNTKDDAEVVSYLNTRKITKVDGTEFVEATLEVDYTAAYAAQVNIKRVVDIIQQRAVILSTSDVASEVEVKDFFNAQSGKIEKVSLDSASVISFLVERANVFDKDIKNFQGVPSAEGKVEEGRSLIDDLAGVPLLTSTNEEVRLAGTAGTSDKGNFGVKVYRVIPALSI